MVCTIRHYRCNVVRPEPQEAPPPKPVRLKSVAMQAALNEVLPRHHKVTEEDVLGKRRFKEIVAARRDLIAELHFKHRWPFTRIAHVLKRDRTSILNLMGLRRSSKYYYRRAA